jgi:hypothetical protein
MNAPFTDRLLGALDAFFAGVMRFLPGLLAALLIVLIGLVFAWVLRLVVRKVLTLARFDRLAESVGFSHLLDRADVRASPSALAAGFLFWIVLLSFMMAALTALEIRAINELTVSFFLYLPRVFAAVIILVVGSLLGSFLARAALLAAVNAGVRSARGVSLVVKLLIAILAFAMALEQLQIARSIVLAAFIISFGAVMLGLALAFGIGGRDLAQRVLERQFKDDQGSRGPDGISHL